MGYLALQDLGATSIKTESNIFQAEIASLDGTFNAGGDYNVLSVKPFNLSFELGKVVDAKDTISSGTSRINLGSVKAVPFTMNATYSRRPTDTNRITASDLDIITYLSIWAENKTIVMMFWMPNENDSTLLSYGQEKDFFTSQLRTLYDVLWDKNTGSSTKGFQATTYGTNHYSVSMGGSIGTYLPCAVPIVIENVTVDEPANSYQVKVSFTGYVLRNEQKGSRL